MVFPMMLARVGKAGRTSASTASAQTPPIASGPAHQLSLSASAQTEVARDQLAVMLQVTREGSDAAQVQTALKQVLDTALNEARRAAEGQQMTVRTSGFSIQPRHGRDGRISGWSGSAGLTLEGRDAARIAALSGRLPGMAIVSTGYSLSRFVVEFFRQADAQFITPDNPLGHVLGAPVWGITMGQLLSLPMLAVGLGFLIAALLRPRVPGPVAA